MEPIRDTTFLNLIFIWNYEKTMYQSLMMLKNEFFETKKYFSSSSTSVDEISQTESKEDEYDINLLINNDSNGQDSVQSNFATTGTYFYIYLSIIIITNFKENFKNTHKNLKCDEFFLEKERLSTDIDTDSNTKINNDNDNDKVFLPLHETLKSIIEPSVHNPNTKNSTPSIRDSEESSNDHLTDLVDFRLEKITTKTSSLRNKQTTYGLNTTNSNSRKTTTTIIKYDDQSTKLISKTAKGTIHIIKCLI